MRASSYPAIPGQTAQTFSTTLYQARLLKNQLGITRRIGQRSTICADVNLTVPFSAASS